MNIITIDPSITCTAMVVNGKIFNYVSDNVAMTKTENLKKWFKIVLENGVFLRLHSQKKETTFSDSEIGKLKIYDDITSSILDDILLNIDPKKESIIAIEGYSYSSVAGPLIDLVSFGTLLRSKLYKNITDHIEIIPPSTLKMESAKLTYQPTNINEGKPKAKPKYVWQNNEGVKGGSFKKHEMFKCLIENEEFDNEWVNFLKENKEEITKTKHIPKPIEDINDAMLLYEYIKVADI